MNNLPEGVSASDPHVVGVTETDSFQTVGECAYLGRRVFRLYAGIMRPRRGPRRVSSVVCTFEGADDVPGVLVDARTEVLFIWECPVCTRQNETTMPDDILDPDPDRYRD